VVSRDIKPSNIVLHEGPKLAQVNALRRQEKRPSLYTAKLCDFGYSKDYKRSDPKSLVRGAGWLVVLVLVLAGAGWCAARAGW
jgi:serine/threonine protein kinase